MKEIIELLKSMDDYLSRIQSHSVSEAWDRNAIYRELQDIYRVLILISVILIFIEVTLLEIWIK